MDKAHKQRFHMPSCKLEMPDVIPGYPGEGLVSSDSAYESSTDCANDVVSTSTLAQGPATSMMPGYRYNPFAHLLMSHSASRTKNDVGLNLSLSSSSTPVSSYQRLSPTITNNQVAIKTNIKPEPVSSNFYNHPNRLHVSSNRNAIPSDNNGHSGHLCSPTYPHAEHGHLTLKIPSPIPMMGIGHNMKMHQNQMSPSVSTISSFEKPRISPSHLQSSDLHSPQLSPSGLMAQQCLQSKASTSPNAIKMPYSSLISSPSSGSISPGSRRQLPESGVHHGYPQQYHHLSLHTSSPLSKSVKVNSPQFVYSQTHTQTFPVFQTNHSNSMAQSNEMGYSNNAASISVPSVGSEISSNNKSPLLNHRATPVLKEGGQTTISLPVPGRPLSTASAAASQGAFKEQPVPEQHSPQPVFKNPLPKIERPFMSSMASSQAQSMTCLPNFYSSASSLIADLSHNSCLLSIAEDYHIDQFTGEEEEVAMALCQVGDDIVARFVQWMKHLPFYR